MVAAALSWRWSGLATATDRPTEQAVRALHHLRLVVAVVGLGRTQREARTEVACDRRTGRVPQPR